MRIALLTALFVLTACQLAGPGGKTVGGTDPITGAEIEVTTLDAPVEGLAAAEAADARAEPGADAPAPADDAAATTDAAVTDIPAADEAVADEPAAEDPTATDPAAADTPPEVVIDPAQQTPEALACTRKGGRWTKIGEGETRACVKITRDGGKHCGADRDCQGVCLARSQTCAPATPLFGCNEVLQDDGRRMNLCLE
jgi:hypothetical protein